MRKTILATIVALALAPVGVAEAQQAADSLYRAARASLNQQEFGRASSQFADLRRMYPRSEHAADSYYWQAFALQRSGDLSRAVSLLSTQISEHPNASTSREARALRTRICGELARRGDEECAAEVSRAARQAQQGEVDERTRLAAVNALMNMEDSRATSIAQSIVENRSQPVAVRKQALFIVSDKAEPEAARRILSQVALDRTDDTEVRKQAVFWLSEVDGEETIDLLARILENDDDQELHDQAIFAISQVGGTRAMNMLQGFATNTALDVDTRKKAIFWLGEEGGDEGSSYLRGIYPRTNDDEIKKQILFAVAEGGGQASLNWLMERARDGGESVDVRKTALFWAADAGLSADDMARLYDSSTEREMKDQIIWLLADEGGDEGIDKLMDIARNDPDTRMREKAIFWLGDSNDPRAAEFLLELIQG